MTSGLGHVDGALSSPWPPTLVDRAAREMYRQAPVSRVASSYSPAKTFLAT